MPARVVVVLGPDLSEETAAALDKAGYEAAALADPMTALDALESAERVELLITRLDFGHGKPNGTAPARMTRHKRPKIAEFSSVPLISHGTRAAWVNIWNRQARFQTYWRRLSAS
jgi:hypothetical protein